MLLLYTLARRTIPWEYRLYGDGRFCFGSKMVLGVDNRLGVARGRLVYLGGQVKNKFIFFE